MPENDSERRNGFESQLRIEADAVLAAQAFVRSPALSKLFRYLVEETIAGRADKLKSFAVAVDGLGRSEKFDPASDSSARVMMVRLRKTLESYYAQHGPVDQLCIFLQPGSYRVRMARLATAYPSLYRPLSDNPVSTASTEHHPPDDATLTSTERPDTGSNRRFLQSRKSQAAVFVLATLMIAMAIIGIWAGFGWIEKSRRTPTSPVLEIMPVETAATRDMKERGDMIFHSLADDLPRFKLSRVRVVAAGEDVRQPSGGEHIYRLTSRLDAFDPKGQTLFLRLNDLRTNTVFWSREIKLPQNTDLIATALVPVSAEINGSFGAIATHETAIFKDWDNGGYSCLLKYFTFVSTREPAIEDQVDKCLKKPVKEQQMVATLLAARALFAIERSSALRDLNAAAAEGLNFARAAIAEDPNDGSANFAMARISYVKGDCVSARFYTKRALDTNSNSPMITATLAALANSCAYPDSEELLNQAIMTQSPRFAKGRLLLIMAILSQNRPDRLDEVLPSDFPQSRYNRVNYYLSETLLAAADNRRTDAARNWKLFLKNNSAKDETAEENLSSIVLMPTMRRRVIELLHKGGAFEN